MPKTVNDEQLHAHLDSGWDSAFAGDLHRALLAAERTLDLDQNSAEAHHLLGFIRSAEGNVADALEHFEHAISLDDGFVEALISAADLRFVALEDAEGALRYLDDALEHAVSVDEIANASLLRSEILRLTGHEEEARAVLRRVPSARFENPAVEALLGQAFVDIGEVERGERLLANALERDPDHPDIHYNLGRAYEIMGDKQRSDAHFLYSRELESRLEGPAWSLSARDFEQRMRTIFDELPEDLLDVISGSAVIITMLPGAEVVAEGVDPRLPMMFDDLQPSGKIGRIFFYQVNIERLCVSPDQIGERASTLLIDELRAYVASPGQ